MEFAGKRQKSSATAWIWRSPRQARSVEGTRFWGYFYFDAPAGGG